MTPALASRSHDALATTFEQHHRHLVAVAGRRSWVDGDDAVQDVMVDMIARPGQHDPERGPLVGLLVTKARSRVIDLTRSESARTRRQERWHEDEPTGPDPLASAMQHDVSARLRRALAALPEREREPLVLAYYGDHSYRDVAEMTGVPEGTVKSRIRSGLKRMRSELQETGMGAN